MGRGHPPAKAGRRRVLGKAARLFLLFEPWITAPLALLSTERVDGAAAPLAGAVGGRDSASSGRRRAKKEPRRNTDVMLRRSP